MQNEYKMFTGIVSFVFLYGLKGRDLFIYPSFDGFYELIRKGDSVAVNGVCLTVVEINSKKGWVRFEVTEETLKKTTFLTDRLKIANIELALKSGDRLGGHIVSGHVFQTGYIDSLDLKTGDLWIFFLPLEGFSFSSLVKYKGSIAVNGVSLTVCDVDASNNRVKISLIPHTINNTTFHQLKKNDPVNLEFDVSNVQEGKGREREKEEKQEEEKDDDYWMGIAIKEAEKGRETTFPNPWVGCVIVKDGKLLTKGYHQRAGQDHAEVMAIKNYKGDKTDLEGSTLYCTLEPCAHLETLCYPNPCQCNGECPKGTRSLSCSQTIIQYKIKRVVVGILDPDTRVSGKGVGILKSRGIETEVSSAEVRDKILTSLEPYIYHRVTGLPFVTLKVALTPDGCYKRNGPGDPWITHSESRKDLYRIWRRSDAILIGGDTLQKDRPLLDTTDFPHEDSEEELQSVREPVFSSWKVVLDSKGLTNLGLPLLKGERTLVFTENEGKWKGAQCKVVYISPRKIDQVVEYLGKMGIMSLLVEGGGKVHKSFLKARYGDRLLIFRGSKNFGRSGVQWRVPDGVDLSYASSLPVYKEDILNTIETYYITYLSASEGISGETSDGSEMKVKQQKEQKEKRMEMESERREEKEKKVEIESERGEESEVRFTPMEEAINWFSKGGMVVVLDDERRENEGDLIVAAGLITEEQMTQMINDATGIICTPMDKATAMRLALPQMVTGNTDPHKTAFTVSVDHISTGTGVSSKDRLKTVRALADASLHPNSLRRPGHIFPLVAHSEGLQGRQGHTEAAVALCELAGIYPRVAVISELKNSDGTMKKRDDCLKYAKSKELPVITVEQLKGVENKCRLLASCELMTKCELSGRVCEWDFRCYDSGNLGSPHKVLILNGDSDFEDIEGESMPVRIHSECFTGDVLGSMHCDCGEQLKKSIEYMADAGKGILIFPSGHEGRGIGILEKVKCYKAQKEGKGTFQANVDLGHLPDARTYDDIRLILRRLGAQKGSIRLLTSNPSKVESLGDIVFDTVDLSISPEETNRKYLEDKKSFFSGLTFH